MKHLEKNILPCFPYRLGKIIKEFPEVAPKAGATQEENTEHACQMTLIALAATVS